jgi:UV DNA damage endonuclease
MDLPRKLSIPADGATAARSPLGERVRVKSTLGLVCQTTTDEIRYRTITRTRLRSFAPDVQVSTLRELYLDNVCRISAAVDFCVKHRLRLYRLPSGLFPQCEDQPGYDVLFEMADALGAIGARATALGLRLVMHPDQFVVLSSDTPHVIVNSIEILRHHARVLDLLRQPRSQWTAVEIHGGKGDRADTLVRVISELPDEIRTRLALENDEYAYSAGQILDICRRTGVPMVFDAHHHVVHEELDSYEHPSVAEATAAARETWSEPSWQMVHISNGRDSFGDPKHADYISVMPSAFRTVPWIEVEAKQKELAVKRLRRTWR